MSLAALRRSVAKRAMHAHLPPPQAHQPPQYQLLTLSQRTPFYPSDMQPSPTWTKVTTGHVSSQEKQAMPKIQWVSAYEYDQQRGQPEHFEQHGMTEALWAKWGDLHYRLVDSADKYLIDNPTLDDAACAEVWARWSHEAEEHLAYHGIMTWRYHSFTESNLEVVPPGQLREELRYTAPNDLHPDTQEEVHRIRQEWLPPHFRFAPLPDPMRVSRQHAANRDALLKLVDQQESEWTGKAATAQEQALVASYCNLWRRALAPSCHVTVEAIERCNDLPTLQEMFEVVFADNGDDRLYAIARRAASLTGDSTAKKLADWCAGLAARDADADARKVKGVPMKASSATDAEKTGAALPSDFSDITDGASLKAYVDFYAGHWKRAMVTYAPKERTVMQNAWRTFEASVSSMSSKKGGKIEGGAVRRAWWDALAHAGKGSAYYAPPLLPVRRDAHGTRFMLRMLGSLNRQGAFDAVYEQDPSYVADALAHIDFNLLSRAEIDEILEEYPGFGVNWSKTPEDAKQRVRKAGCPAFKGL